MRAISTAVDVTVFLLLVSASVATLTLVPDDEADPVVVDDRAEVLASTTADIEYSMHTSERVAHGTIASLLARGAIANATIDEHPLAPGHGEYVDEVSTATRRAIDTSNRTQVLVHWEPYRGAPIEGSLRVGADPPPGRDVTVATLTVPVLAGLPTDRTTRAGQNAGFRGVARHTAVATADALLPRSAATLPSGRVSPASVRTSRRLSALADATDVSIERELADGNVSGARSKVLQGLADRYEVDMRERFDEPADAAAAVRAGTVRITLRRWDA